MSGAHKYLWAPVYVKYYYLTYKRGIRKFGITRVDEGQLSLYEDYKAIASSVSPSSAILE